MQNHTASLTAAENTISKPEIKSKFKSKKVFVKTFDCQMNEYDSDKMADILQQAQGYALTQKPENVDLILFNTCSVREKAQEKVCSGLG